MNVKASCVICGDFEIAPEKVKVHVATLRSDQLSRYEINCPKCGELIDRKIAPAWIDALAKAGAQMIPWQIPEEAFEPRSGKPLTLDDLLDFHFALDSTDLIVELLDESTKAP